MQRLLQKIDIIIMQPLSYLGQHHMHLFEEGNPRVHSSEEKKGRRNEKNVAF